jgi:hypothetical protein
MIELGLLGVLVLVLVRSMAMPARWVAISRARVSGGLGLRGSR